MEDLLQPQIRDSYRLAMPDGLRDLMCDISREVLRAQPSNLYNFIVGYLEALLLARDTLSIACRVCRDVCECTCQPELEMELVNLGLEGEELRAAKNVVLEYLDKAEVKEGNLLMELLKKTNIEAELLPAVQEAVRAAFLKHQLDHQDKRQEEANKITEKGQRTAQHTLSYYTRAEDEQGEAREKAAKKIQACFRGYLVRRHLKVIKSKPKRKKEKTVKTKEANETVKLSGKSWTREPARAYTNKAVRNKVGRLSSTTLAGSLIDLPKYVPYSVHNMTYEAFEDHETESKNIDYTLEVHLKDLKIDEGKKIGFREKKVLHDIESCSVIEEIEGNSEETDGYSKEETSHSDVETVSDVQKETTGEYNFEMQVTEEEIAEDIQSDGTEESKEIEENISHDKLLVKSTIQGLVTTDSGHEHIETAADNSIEENISENDIYSDDETDEEQHKREPLNEEIKELGFIEEIKNQEDLNEEIIELSDSDD